MRIPLLVLSLVLALSLPALAGDQPKELVGMWQVVLPDAFKAQLDEMKTTLEANPDDEMAKAAVAGMNQAAEMKMEFTADGRVIAHMGAETEEAKWSAKSTGKGIFALSTIDTAGTEETVKAVITGDTLTISDDTDDPPLAFTRVAAASSGSKKKK